ncbi:MAG: plasmid pRiA4b ORF-3 family protein [Nocardioidaceae bacterium]|nr:plasmid pRiA4b ORF-3 family protein [Nocardioidaceae bacterium]
MSDDLDPPDVDEFVAQLMAEATPEQKKALIESLMTGRVTSMFDKLTERGDPTLAPVPDQVLGLRVRLDLKGAKPPIWRRLELPGDLTLPRVHDVIQAAMGWTNSHLHRFRTARDHRAPYFLTQFDLEEGDEGMLEDDVRLDQLLTAKGDELFYEYDFGDGWQHVLKLEAILDEPPATARCVSGKLACPPEDCGGLGGYDDLATWVRSGYNETQLPDVFDDADDAREWLPLDWHPDHIDLDHVNASLAVATAEPVAVKGELAELCEQLDRHGVRLLREVLGRPMSHGWTDLPDSEAERITHPYRVLLEAIGTATKLTSAGYLPPTVVEQIAVEAGIAEWWIGKANREDLTPPVAAIRDSVRALGIVYVRDGHLRASRAGIQGRRDPQKLWRHIVGRLPLGTKDWERQSGWMALAVAASGTPIEQWRGEISELMLALGWRNSRDLSAMPSADSATLDILLGLAGENGLHWRDVKGVDFAVATTARAAIRAMP